VRKALLVSAAGWLAISATARAQQASLFTGTVTNTHVQWVTVVDKAPLMAPVPAPPQSSPMYLRILNRLFGVLQPPTIGANPVASVSTTPQLSSPVTQATFQPGAPFMNPQ
jgi:hypothetical protein